MSRGAITLQVPGHTDTEVSNNFFPSKSLNNKFANVNESVKICFGFMVGARLSVERFLQFSNSPPLKL